MPGVAATTVVVVAAGATGCVTGATEVDGAAAAAATTVTDCDAAPAAYTSLPDWLADKRHVPAALNVTTPTEIEHTDCDWLATATVGARNTSLSTDTV